MIFLSSSIHPVHIACQLWDSFGFWLIVNLFYPFLMSPSDGIKMSKPLLGRRCPGPKRLDHRRSQNSWGIFGILQSEQSNLRSQCKVTLDHLSVFGWNSPIHWQDASSLCNFKLFKSAISLAFLGSHKMRDSSIHNDQQRLMDHRVENGLVLVSIITADFGSPRNWRKLLC